MSDTPRSQPLPIEPTPRRRLRAYNLVVLAVAVGLLNIWIASTLPLWSSQIQRDKEAELIFRGLQIAEGIRVFQQRFQKLPVKLEELVESEPRCLRQLWRNPMREDGRWGLIPVGMTPGQPVPGQPGQRPPGLPPDESSGFGDGGEEGEEPGVILSTDPDDEFGGPPSNIAIRGVYSPTGDEPFRTFLGKESIREWLFTVELVSSIQQGTPDNPALQRPFLAKFIGRPWPPGVLPQVPQPSDKPQPAQGQQGGGQQGGQQGGGQQGGGQQGGET